MREWWRGARVVDRTHALAAAIVLPRQHPRGQVCRHGALVEKAGAGGQAESSFHCDALAQQLRSGMVSSWRLIGHS